MEISRREFLSLSVSVGAMMIARPAHAQPLHRRKNVNDLTPPELAKYRAGVAAMKVLTRDKPSSWIYQAAVHGIAPAMSPSNPLADPPGVANYWRQCKHGHPHFFSWHRWELLYWEEFCRQLCGDPKFALPYWDWMADAHLPDAYRNPADPNTNPLYDANRNASINNGTAQVNGLALNGYTATDFLQFSSQFEGNPHGLVHTSVGAGGGDMRAVPTAGLDPVFYAHHANIDRHWVEWLRQGGGRANPTGAWLTESFTFQSLGGPQTPTAGGAVTTDGLGYTYDRRPVVVPADALKFLRELRRPYRLPPVRVIPNPPRPPGPGPDPAPWKSLAALSAFDVNGEPTLVPVPKESGGVRTLRDATEARNTDVAIELRGISIDRAAAMEGFAVQAFLVPSSKDAANGRLSEAVELGTITSFNLDAVAEHGDHAPPTLLLSDAAKKLLNRSADKDPAIVLVRRSLLKDNLGKEIPFDASKKLFSVKELHLAARKR